MVRPFLSLKLAPCEIPEDALHSRFEALAEQSGQLASILDDAVDEIGGPGFPVQAEAAERVLEIPSFSGLSEMVRQEVLWRFVANGCGAFLSYPAVRAIADLASEKEFTWPLGSGWQLSLSKAELDKADKVDKGAARLVLSPPMKKTREQVWRANDLLVVHNSTPSLSLRVVRGGEFESQRKESEGYEGSCQFLLYNLPLNTTVTLRGAKLGDRFCLGPSSRARAIKLTYFLHQQGKDPVCVCVCVCVLMSTCVCVVVVLHGLPYVLSRLLALELPLPPAASEACTATLHTQVPREARFGWPVIAVKAGL